MISFATTWVRPRSHWPPTSGPRLTRSARPTWCTRTGISSPHPRTASAPPTSRCSASTCGAPDPRSLPCPRAEPAEQDVEAAFKFGGPVIAGEVGGEAAEDGKFADRQAVQPEAEQVVGLIGVLHEFLQLVEHVAEKEPEQGTVDVQGVCPAESGPREQGEDVLEGAQG